jgi:hypothetical protein
MLCFLPGGNDPTCAVFHTNFDWTTDSLSIEGEMAVAGLSFDHPCRIFEPDRPYLSANRHLR